MAAEQVWSVKAALDWTTTFLAEKSDEHPRRSAEWLLSAATGLSRVELYAFHDRPLSDSERATLRESVRRRAAGEPLQYVTGEVAFRHLVLKVRPGVLIPRPETEVLVDTVIAEVRRVVDERGEAIVADLCTGSGCVALSIASECPGSSVFASDLSAIAVEIAAENAARLGLGEAVTTLSGDLFSALPQDARGTLDVIVSNPPYVPSADVPGACRPRSLGSSHISRWMAESTGLTSSGAFLQVGVGGCGPGAFWRSNSTKEWCGKRPRKR